jgi:hypothetical protein
MSICPFSAIKKTNASTQLNNSSSHMYFQLLTPAIDSLVEQYSKLVILGEIIRLLLIRIKEIQYSAKTKEANNNTAPKERRQQKKKQNRT